MARKKRYTKPFRESDRNYLLEDILLVVLVATIVFVLLMLTGCERRELYVYGDEFHSVELEVDWRKYADRDPDGMTVWFYPLDTEGTVLSVHKPYRTTTANVRHHDLYLPGGYYQGVVVDYSPEEFSRQEFLSLERMDSARVEATPSSYQPDSLTVAGEGVPKGLSDEVNWQLYGEPAWTDYQYPRPPVREATGLYEVANQPEEMALDTLDNRHIDRSEYGDYIPWKERETYQSQIRLTQMYSEPETIVWKLRIRVWVRAVISCRATSSPTIPACSRSMVGRPSAQAKTQVISPRRSTCSASVPRRSDPTERSTRAGRCNRSTATPVLVRMNPSGGSTIRRTVCPRTSV